MGVADQTLSQGGFPARQPGYSRNARYPRHRGAKHGDQHEKWPSLPKGATAKVVLEVTRAGSVDNRRAQSHMQLWGQVWESCLAFVCILISITQPESFSNISKL